MLDKRINHPSIRRLNKSTWTSKTASIKTGQLTDSSSWKVKERTEAIAREEEDNFRVEGAGAEAEQDKKQRIHKASE